MLLLNWYSLTDLKIRNCTLDDGDDVISALTNGTYIRIPKRLWSLGSSTFFLPAPSIEQNDNLSQGFHWFLKWNHKVSANEATHFVCIPFIHSFSNPSFDAIYCKEFAE